MRAIVWFRNDLRVQDNEVLTKAVADYEEVFPVYCFDEQAFQESPIGIARMGRFRAEFLCQAVEGLRESLQRLGSDLIVRHGDPVKAIAQLAEVLQVDAVLASKEATPEEIAMEQALEAALWKQEIKFDLNWQSTLYPLDDLPFPVKHLPNVFTAFRKKVEKESRVQQPIAAPEKMPAVEGVNTGSLPNLGDFGLAEKPFDDRSVVKFIGGEAIAWKRLNYYFWETELLATYKETRNGLVGGDYSSKFSPWLALGCISPRSIYHEVKRFEKTRKKNSSTYWLIFELIWRDFFRYTAYKFGPRLFQVGGLQGRSKPHWENQRQFDRWCHGATGVPFIDANMHELNTTGFMSNRGRQNVASYLVNDLNINWTWGAWYFESMLIDYDPCSNWGNWAYVAGVGNDPRQDRYFNIESQASRYDPDGTYVGLWLDEATIKS
ncbi:MAG: DASH family cryptochrome [Bacteroidota bacterium]